MYRKVLNFLKTSKIFYIGLIAIIYYSIDRGINLANENSIEKYTIKNHSAVRYFIPNERLGVTQGILIFFTLIIIWIFLIKLFSIFTKDRKFFNSFFTLGELSVDNIITKLFYIGFFIVAFKASIFKRFFSSIILNYVKYNSFMDTISYIITFSIMLVLWKITCELLIVLFRCFESYYEVNKKDLKE